MSNADSLQLTIESANPSLDLCAFETNFDQPLGELTTPGEVLELLRLDATNPFEADAEVVPAVRELLRRGGFKPSGRSKPASEYLRKAAQEEGIKPINVAVDVCNAVSLHSGLPISVVDLARALPPLHVGVAAAGSSYVFNLSGQVIEVGGLLCLFDSDGPCASPVKDSQRTKTNSSTSRTLTLIWGTHALPGRAAETRAWYRGILTSLGAETRDIG